MDIRPMGRLLSTDVGGFLVNGSSLDAVPATWMPLVAASIAAYRERLGADLHSVWLRGSVVNGSTADGISDLDTFAIVRAGDRPEPVPWAMEVHERLVAEYPFCTGVEFSVFPLSFVRANARFRILVKGLSVPAWGEDIRSELPSVRPDAALVRTCWDLERGVEEYRRALREVEDLTGLWTWVFKHLLRCAQLLAVEAEGSYGRDLYPCWDSFSRVHPEWRERAREALQFCLSEPQSDAEQERARALVDELAAFLRAEYERRYG
jgi:hypothetical protein